MQFVPDVAPYEHMKIRILNGGHAAIAYPAALLDIHFVHEAMEDADIRAFLAKLERLVTVMMLRGTDPNLVLDRYAAVVREMKARRAADLPSLELSDVERAEARRSLADNRFGLRDRFRMPMLLKINDLISREVLDIDPKTVSCEHILPRNAPAGSPWRSAFRAQDGRRYEGGRYVHMLGNLTVLAHAENRQADTLPFDDKRPIFKRSAFAISNDVAKNKAWNPQIVVARTERLARLLADHLKL